MKHLFPIIIIIMAFLHSCSSQPKMASDNNGRIFTEGDVAVLDLHGSWYQMGRQYGILAKDKMIDVLAYVDGKLKDEPGRIASATEIAEKLYAHYPQHLKDFLQGVSETSDLSIERVKLCNAAEYVEGAFFCSAMATWGDYAQGPLVFGRNYDAVSYAEIGKDVVVTVYHPDGEMAAATIGYAGELYCVNGMNEQGLFFELNNGMPSAGWDIHWELCPSTTLLFDLMFQAKTMDDVDRFFKQQQSFASFIIGVGCKEEARAYEWCYDGVERADTKTPEGLMAITNHYVNDAWQFATPSNKDSWNSLIRHTNLLERAQELKGRFDVEMMEGVMSTAIEDGGPLHKLTRYQIVAVPESETLYLRIGDAENWTRIDLGSYLGGKMR